MVSSLKCSSFDLQFIHIALQCKYPLCWETKSKVSIYTRYPYIVS